MVYPKHSWVWPGKYGVDNKPGNNYESLQCFKSCGVFKEQG